MSFLLTCSIAAILIYLFLKFAIHLYKPYLLSKNLEKINKMYERSMGLCTKRSDFLRQDVQPFRIDDTAAPGNEAKETLAEKLQSAETLKAHEQEVHRKFLRLQERFFQDPNKLSEVILIYHRYLSIRLQYEKTISFYPENRWDDDDADVDETTASSKDLSAILEENERKLDVLLSQ